MGKGKMKFHYSHFAFAPRRAKMMYYQDMAKQKVEHQNLK
jgi:hypothetical protein